MASVASSTYSGSAIGRRNDQTAVEGSTSHWYGRPINCGKNVVNAITSFAQGVLNQAGLIASDPNALAAIFRRLDCQVLDAIGHFNKHQAYYCKTRDGLRHFVGFVDTLQLAGDAFYFSSGKYKEDSNVKFVSRIALCAADVGGALLWSQELGLLKLGQIGDKLGKFRVLAPLTKISLGTVAGGSLALYYFLSAVDSIQNLAKGRLSTSGKIQTALELSYYSSEVTLSAMLAAGTLSPVGLGVLGAVCLTTGITAFVHRSYVKPV